MMQQVTENNKLDTKLMRKRLHFRSWHRGTREMDMILGRFADQYLPSYEQAQLERYERLLKNSDPDLYNWLSGNEPLPPAEDSDVMQDFLGFELERPDSR
jgi:antitoxin CptB